MISRGVETPFFLQDFFRKVFWIADLFEVAHIPRFGESKRFGGLVDDRHSAYGRGFFGAGIEKVHILGALRVQYNSREGQSEIFSAPET